MSARRAHLPTTQTFCRSEPKALEPNLLRRRKPAVLGQTAGEHLIPAGLQRVSLPGSAPLLPVTLLTRKHQKIPQEAQCPASAVTGRDREKGLVWRRGGWQEEEGLGLWLPTTAAGPWDVCGEPGPPSASGQPHRAGDSDGRIVKEWQLWPARWISPVMWVPGASPAKEVVRGRVIC